jgi:hypothetical protein
MLPERSSIADDLVSYGRAAAVKDDDLVALLLERPRKVRTDEPAATDQENSHSW